MDRSFNIRTKFIANVKNELYFTFHLVQRHIKSSAVTDLTPRLHNHLKRSKTEAATPPKRQAAIFPYPLKHFMIPQYWFRQAAD
ncbi:hypothetical protein J6590_065697 [Homalodisca vitripennis]|nr:hypothetical protein J6590_065697 [Homalodisca vitripennis]